MWVLIDACFICDTMHAFIAGVWSLLAFRKRMEGGGGKQEVYEPDAIHDLTELFICLEGFGIYHIIN